MPRARGGRNGKPGIPVACDLTRSPVRFTLCDFAQDINLTITAPSYFVSMSAAIRTEWFRFAYGGWSRTSFDRFYASRFSASLRRRRICSVPLISRSVRTAKHCPRGKSDSFEATLKCPAAQ